MTTEPRSVRTAVAADLVRGAAELEPTAVGVRPHRLPAWARDQAGDPQLALAESQPAGVRLVFNSNAISVELRALATRFGFAGAPARSPGVFELLVDRVPLARASLPAATMITIDPATGVQQIEPGKVESVVFDGLPAGDKLVEIWLPHNESVELVELRSDAPVSAADRTRPLWLHHGSSISQGSNADRPTGVWTSVAAAAANLELINLGLSGSALLDPFTARTMRDTQADLISVKLGINVVNADLMRLRAFGPAVHGFLDTIRDGHRDTPLLVVSALHCPIHEDTPGPGAFDLDALAGGSVQFRATGDPGEVASGRLTLSVIREQLDRIVRERARDDPELHYLDGLRLYGPGDAERHPLPDRLHPDPATHRLIGERFAAIAFAVGGPLDPAKISRR